MCCSLYPHILIYYITLSSNIWEVDTDIDIDRYSGSEPGVSVSKVGFYEWAIAWVVLRKKSLPFLNVHSYKFHGDLDSIILLYSVFWSLRKHVWGKVTDRIYSP